MAGAKCLIPYFFICFRQVVRKVHSRQTIDTTRLFVPHQLRLCMNFVRYKRYKRYNLYPDWISAVTPSARQALQALQACYYIGFYM